MASQKEKLKDKRQSSERRISRDVEGYSKYWFDKLQEHKGEFGSSLDEEQQKMISSYDEFLSVWESPEDKFVDSLLDIQRVFYEKVAYQPCIPFEVDEEMDGEDVEEKKPIPNFQKMLEEFKFDEKDIQNYRMENFSHFCEGDYLYENKLKDSVKYPWGKGEKSPFKKETSTRFVLYKHMYRVWNEIYRHEKSWPFHEPVDTGQVQDYLTFVQDPIDLGKIHAKMKTKQYKTKEEFAADLKKIFDNCRKYNSEEGNLFRVTGDDLERYVNDLLETIPDNIVVLKNDVHFGLGRKKKGKAEDERAVKRGQGKGLPIVAGGGEGGVLLAKKKTKSASVEEKERRIQPMIPGGVPFREQSAITLDKDRFGEFYLGNFGITKGGDGMVSSDEDFDPYEVHGPFLANSLPLLGRKWRMRGGGGLLLADRFIPPQKMMEDESKSGRIEFDACDFRSKKIVDNINGIEKIRKLRRHIDTNSKNKLDDDEELCIPDKPDKPLMITNKFRAMTVMKCCVGMMLSHAGFEEVSCHVLVVLSEVILNYIHSMSKALKTRWELNLCNIPFHIILLQVMESFGVKDPLHLVENWKYYLQKTEYSIEIANGKLRKERRDRRDRKKRKRRRNAFNNFQPSFKRQKTE